MSKKRDRSYSIHTRSAVSLLGRAIRVRRKQLNQSAAELAQRGGISRTTLHKIETGELSCEIGLVFEVAILVGIPLFNEDKEQLIEVSNHLLSIDSLLPKRIDLPAPDELNNDF